MRLQVMGCVAGLVAVATLLGAGTADTPTTVPAAADLSPRQQSLLLQLADAEANIKALNLALVRVGYKVGLAYDRIENGQKANELMDRKGGGPVRWDAFYGKTARDFYVPTDEGKLHAQWIGGNADIHVATGYHPVSRPPQFDLIYRANDEQIARAREQAASLVQNEATLLARRQKHESDQSRLWAMIAFERIKDLEVGFEPLCRFKLKSTIAGSDGRREGLRGIVLFLRTGDRVAADGLESIERNQDGVFADLGQRMNSAYAALQSSLADAQLAGNWSEADKARLQLLKGTCKQAADEGSVALDNYVNALDRDRANEDNSKLVFRGALQESLASFAADIALLNAQVSDAAKGWAITAEAGVVSTDAVPARAPVAQTPAAQENRPTTPAPSRATPAEPVSPHAPIPAITIYASPGVRVASLEIGAPRLYDSNPLRKIEKVSPDLRGYQFTAIPQRVDTSFEIHVNKPTTIYVFGFRARTHVTREQVFGPDAGKWQDADQAIQGTNLVRCFRRTVPAGEVIRLTHFEEEIAAETIELANAP